MVNYKFQLNWEANSIILVHGLYSQEVVYGFTKISVALNISELFILSVMNLYYQPPL
jgi:hypothetical protein